MDTSIVLEARSQILIVDDSLDDLSLLRKILRDKGYGVHSTPQAERALQFLESHTPDLILTDLHMAGMDGYELCEILAANVNTRDIPVIVVSGADQVVDKMKAFSKGVADYILKPYVPVEVLARIRTHLSLRNLQKDLEVRVKERTRDLTKAIASLQEEVDTLRKKN